MENNNKIPETPQPDVPYIIHESAMARMEIQLKRLWIVLIMTILLLVGTNAAWIWYESQFEEITITAEQTADGQGSNYAIGGDFYGSESESDGESPAQEDGR